MRIKTTGVAALALLPFVALAGCGVSTKDALAFNQKIVAANQKLEAVGQEFGEAIGRAATGNPADVANAKQMYDKTRQTLEQVKSEMQSVQVPPSDAARALYDAHQKFLEGQQRIVDKDFGEVMKLLDDTKSNTLVRGAKIVAILGRVEQTGQTELESLKGAQRAFAKEYNIILK